MSYKIILFCCAFCIALVATKSTTLASEFLPLGEEIVADFSTGDITETITEEVTEDVTETITEEVTEDITETITEEVTEDVTETITEEVTEDVTETITEEVTEDVTETITEDVTEVITECNTFDITDIISLFSSVQPYANVSASDSIISEPYLSYLTDIALRRAPLKHYVCYVSRETSGSYSSYVYCIAVGDLSLSGSSFSGSVTIYKFYASPSTYFPRYRVVNDSSFTLSTGTDLAFTDLDSNYPDLTSKYFPQYFALYMFGAIVVFLTVTSFFGHKRRG